MHAIGFSVKSCGLPFVLPGTHPPAQLRSQYTGALQDAYQHLSPESSQRLHLVGFEAVDLDDYASILEFERYAFDHGFDLLN